MTSTPVQTGKRAIYPAYKPSGIEWLGDVPEHWEVLAFKRLGDFQAGAGFPNDEQGLADDDLPFYKVSDSNLPGNEVFMTTHNNAVSHETARRLRAHVFPRDTIVFAKVGAALLLNKRRILSRPSCIDNNMMGFIGRSCDRNWGYFWMCSLDLGDLANPGAVPSINEGQIREIRVPLPPLPEQRAIAAFLDRETARIDALIEKKRRQIELLKEKRSALISHAVTKGLNPNAPMKDSGIEWLGEVPEHWTVGNIRRFAKMRTGHTPSRTNPEYWQNCTIPWFTLADVWQLRDGKRKYLGETKEKISEIGLASSAAELLPKGTVVFSRTASVGFSGIMPQPMATSQDFWNWVCLSSLLPEYLLCLFRSMRQEFEAITRGSTHKTIYQPIAAGIMICVPPLAEQKGIAGYIDAESGRIDSLIQKVEQSIEGLRELRTALISAAVTGKIDVRGGVE